MANQVHFSRSPLDNVFCPWHAGNMKKRTHRKTHARKSASNERYLVVVRSWMIVVVFALMLGVGAVVGTFLNEKLSETTPQVAGVSVEAK